MTTNIHGIKTVPTSGIGAVTNHNDAMNQLDALIHLALSDIDVDSPPSHSEGLAVLVGSSPTGAFSSNAGDVAISLGSAWDFFSPTEGMRAWVSGGSTAPDSLIVYDGSDWRVVDTGLSVHSAAVRFDSPSLNDEQPLMYTTRAITITEILSVVIGSSSPSVTWNVMHATTRSAAGTQVFSSDQTTTSTTTGVVDNSGFGDATIPAGRFVWVEIETAPSGTVDAFELYIQHTIDPVA